METEINDKGYQIVAGLKASKLWMEVMVAVPAMALFVQDQAIDGGHFAYNPTTDCYIYPAYQALTTNGICYNKSRVKSINRIQLILSRVHLKIPIHHITGDRFSC